MWVQERLKPLARRGVGFIDDQLAALSVAGGRWSPSLLIVCFHGIFRDSGEIGQNLRDPQEAVTLDFFTSVLDFLAGLGAVFVNDRVWPPEAGGRLAAWITFDDGYKNNDAALEILKRRRIPATLFPVLDNVADGDSFWWDAMYRAGKKRGLSDAAVAVEIRSNLARPAAEIRARLRSDFGPEILRPVGEADRPYTWEELAARADGGLLTLGNHTLSHLHLGQAPLEDVRRELGQAQERLSRLGRHPASLALPMGFHRPDVFPLAGAAGLDIVLGVSGGGNAWPVPEAGPWFLDRLAINGREPAARQLRRLLSPHSLKRFLKSRFRRAGEAG